MTSGTPRSKRPQRPRGRDLPYTDAFDLALEIAQSERHHAEAAPHDTWRPGDLGRPPLLPPAVYDLFGSIAFHLGSDRIAVAFFAAPKNWEPLRKIYAIRYPTYKGLRPGGKGPNRSGFRRHTNKLAGDPERLEVTKATFAQESILLAKQMGMLDGTVDSLARPAVGNWLSGDGTVLRSRFNNGPGQMQVDRHTGEISEARYDPDAAFHITGDKQRVSGTKFSMVHVRTGYTSELVTLSVDHVPAGSGHSEADVALAQIREILDLAPDARGVIWDKAMRGTHIDQLYDLGLMSLVKVSLQSGGKVKDVLVGPRKTKAGHDVKLRSVNGAAHVEATVDGETVLVRLSQPKILRRRNNNGTYRWYGEYRLPDDPLLPKRLRNDLITERFDTSEEDRDRGFNRSEALRPIADGDERWSTLHSGRPVAESLNAWLKHLWRNGRAPAVTKERQLLRMIYGLRVANTTAWISYQARMRNSSGSPPTQLAA